MLATVSQYIYRPASHGQTTTNILKFLPLVILGFDLGDLCSHAIKYWIRVAGFPIELEMAGLEKKKDLG